VAWEGLALQQRLLLLLLLNLLPSSSGVRAGPGICTWPRQLRPGAGCYSAKRALHPMLLLLRRVHFLFAVLLAIAA
jgi:hypothetical protein